MQIEFAQTPPKKKVTFNYDLSTPPNKQKSPMDCYQTPKKKTNNKKIDQSPVFDYSTPPKGQNPQSKKQNNKNKLISSRNRTPHSSHRKHISEFNISRLDHDYDFIRNLGYGNFSTVGLYQSYMTKQLFAIKTTKLSNMSINEAQALGTLSIFSQQSKNIVRYYHSWVQNNQLYIVMEYCSHTLTSELKSHKIDNKPLKQSEVKDILRQALQGLKCMHQNGMVHLDIKPDNLLFSRKTHENKQSILKISDLGLTRITKLKRDSDLQEGDSRYLAKEVLNYQQGIDLTKSDIFSLGMTIYEAMTLRDLPNNGQQWQDIRHNGLKLTSSMDLTEYSRQLLEIVQIMTHPDFKERASAQKILRMRYFKDTLLKRPKILQHNFFNKKEQKEQRKKDSSV